MTKKLGQLADEVLVKMRSDFTYYAPRALKIRTKNDGIQNFSLNDAQLVIHQRIEEQKRRFGFVRALILKGRQQGASTYVEGRFYWHTSGLRGKQTFILTHEDKATQKIFAMAKRYHELCPAEVKPTTKTANAMQMMFDRLDSGYEVATAGTEAIGRSGTVQYFHGSEVAFWPNAEDHMMGVGQCVPRGPGTEIILESTANGPGNLFHQKWQAAERGEGEYIAIFIPWFIQSEYRANPPSDFMLDKDEMEYMEAHNLELDQMYWRRIKIVDDFNGDINRFKQEYPATAAEAFVVIGNDSFILGSTIMRLKPRAVEARGPLIIGIDPARSGIEKKAGDWTAICRRRGRKVYPIERVKIGDTMVLAGKIARIIKDEKPNKVFIDIGGVGAGVYDRLCELGFGNIVQQVNFGGSADDDEKFANKRTEMWSDMRDFLKMEGISVPEDPVLQADLAGPGFKYKSNGALILESKEDMKKRGVKSPDKADSLALTFAFPVEGTSQEVQEWRKRLKKSYSGETSAQAA